MVTNKYKLPKQADSKITTTNLVREYMYNESKLLGREVRRTCMEVFADVNCLHFLMFLNIHMFQIFVSNPFQGIFRPCLGTNDSKFLYMSKDASIFAALINLFISLPGTSQWYNS